MITSDSEYLRAKEWVRKFQASLYDVNATFIIDEAWKKTFKESYQSEIDSLSRDILKYEIRTSSWIETISGRKVSLLNPEPEQFEITDIAGPLSKLCRYNGHVSQFYSVAQHSVFVSLGTAPEFRLCAILHDASEAYCGDIITPLKPLLTDYKIIERNIMLAISKRFNFPIEHMEYIKVPDARMLATEVRDLIPHHQLDWKLTEPAYPYTIKGISHEKAERMFLEIFEEIVKCPNSPILKSFSKVLMGLD